MRTGWLLVGVTIISGGVAIAVGSSAASAPVAPRVQAVDDSAYEQEYDEQGTPPRDAVHAGVQGADPSVAMGAAAGGDPHGDSSASAQHGLASRAVEPGSVPVATGDNAHTVAEVFRDVATLAGKRVRVAAQVVRSTPGVLGRNWLHVQDGTGSPEAKDFDLVVTTGAVANIGDRVVVDAVVGRDRDIGNGYQYPVLLEEAKLEPAAGAQP